MTKVVQTSTKNAGKNDAEIEPNLKVKQIFHEVNHITPGLFSFWIYMSDFIEKLHIDQSGSY